MGSLWLAVSVSETGAAVSPVESAASISGGTTLNFDGYAHNTIANTLYQSQGITFTRDDGQPVLVYDYVAIGRTTPSPRNVISTSLAPGINTSYATHLNVLSASPLFAVGAYFGNDRGDSDFTSISLSVFGLSGDLLGSVIVAGNGIRSADQFIGLSSDVPFTRIRFDNLNASGGHSTGFAVAVDNFVFSPVPEPSSVLLIVLSLLGIYFARSKTTGRKWVLATPSNHSKSRRTPERFKASRRGRIGGAVR